MGTGRDKRKKAKEKKGEGPAGTGAAKTERRTARNAQKAERRAERALEGDEDDIDALLAQFALQEKSKKEVVIESDCPPPSPRVNASLVPYVTPKGTELVLFGGEVTDLVTGKVLVNADLYRFDCDKAKWTRIRAPSSPSPRCAHQSVIYKGCMYVFGGEFSSPNQERFMHFRDLWRLDLATHEWDQLPARGGPSARSGHRMVLYKNKAVMFGGFYDTGAEVKYYNDLWEFDLTELTWRPVGPPTSGGAAAAGALAPAPRSGCGAAVSGDELYIYGGYSKDPDEEDGEVEHGKAHDDMWALNLKTYTWERVKKAGMAPGPRASFGWAVHKGTRAFLFGGVSDNEAKGGEDLSSEFHNDLYTFSFLNRRWFAAELRPSKAAVKQQQQEEQQQQQPAAGQTLTGQDAAARPVDPKLQALLAAGGNKDSPIYRAAVRIQSRFRGYVVRKAYQLYKVGGVVSELLYSPAAYGLDMSVRNMPKPRARISPQVAVVGNALWLLGGTVEVGDKEITLDDMWTLDLAKLDGWSLIQENTVGEEVFKEAAAAAGADDSSEEED